MNTTYIVKFGKNNKKAPFLKWIKSILSIIAKKSNVVI